VHFQLHPSYFLLLSGVLLPACQAFRQDFAVVLDSINLFDARQTGKRPKQLCAIYVAGMDRKERPFDRQRGKLPA
jgi:hypothetical protein